MTKYYCDRCEKLIEPVSMKFFSNFSINSGTSILIRKDHICEECLKDILIYADNPPDKKRK